MFFEYEKEKPKLLEEIKDLNGDLHIPKGLWRDTIDSYKKEEVLRRLKELINNDEIKFPFREYSLLEVQEEYQRLKTSSESFSKGSWECNRLVRQTDLLYKGQSLYIPRTARLGSRASDLFTQAVRMEVGHQRFLSPKRAWESEKKAFLNYLFNPDMFEGDINDKALRTALSMRSYVASQFKPESAKIVYDTFQAKNVLDFSAGWGDRLVGFLSSNAESYVGIDPNSKLHEPYEKIVEFCVGEKQVEFICSPAEDVNLGDKTFDFVFTSPPYFTLERYSQEDTQSWKRYPKISLWLKKFLFPTLKNCWDHLEDGRIIVNIADAYTNGTREEICSPMLKYMESLGATYEGVLGYQMGGRPGANMDNLGNVFCEPIWVWSKGDAPKPKWQQDTFLGV